jgi:hypothetical protein
MAECTSAPSGFVTPLHGKPEMQPLVSPTASETLVASAALSLALLASAGRAAGRAVLSSPSTTQTIQVKSLHDGHAITGSKAKLHRQSDRQ